MIIVEQRIVFQNSIKIRKNQTTLILKVLNS